MRAGRRCRRGSCDGLETCCRVTSHFTGKASVVSRRLLNVDAISDGGGQFARRFVHIRERHAADARTGNAPIRAWGRPSMTVGHVPATASSAPWQMIGGVVFYGLLAVACAFDIRTRRIPNWLVSVLALSGIVVTVATAPRLSVGLAASLGGLMVGLLIWLPSWLFRLLGAGDVKMFAAAGAHGSECGEHSRGRSSRHSRGESSPSYGCCGIGACGDRL